MVDVNARELLADCFDEQRRDDGRIDAAGEREEHFFIADLTAQLCELFVDKRLRKLRRFDALHVFWTDVV